MSITCLFTGMTGDIRDREKEVCPCYTVIHDAIFSPPLLILHAARTD